MLQCDELNVMSLFKSNLFLSKERFIYSYNEFTDDYFIMWHIYVPRPIPAPEAGGPEGGYW